MEPHILNLNFPAAIETERLTIRSPQPGDGPEFNAAICESLDGLQEWLDIYPDGPPTIEQSEAFVRQKYAEFVLRQNLMLLCFLKGTTTFVVSSGLRPRWNVPSFEIGYWCRKGFQGQGYVTEAVNGITNFAFDFLQARRVFISCDVDNHASANVARRAGYELEGTLRNIGRKQNGDLSDSYYFAKIRPD